MDFVVKVRRKYPYLTPNDASDIVDKAKMFYFALQYPCEPFVTEAERPIESFFAKQWILSACEELVERLGFNSATGYRENGVSWSFDGAELSDRLCNLIKPFAGTF
jgi:hypothetical protein